MLTKDSALNDNDRENRAPSEPIYNKEEAMAIGEKLLEAHIQYLKRELTDAHLVAKLDDEFTRLIVWLKSVPFNQIVKKEQLLDTVASIVVAFPVDNPEVASKWREIFKRYMTFHMSAKAHNNYKLEEVWSSEVQLQVVEKIIDLQRLRNDLVETLLTSSVYAELISDLLYNGIKGFILEENFLSKLPGLSSLIKMGKWGMSRTIPNIETLVEGAAKTFIVNNIPNTIALSKKILESSLSPEYIRRLGINFWEHAANKDVAILGRYFNEEDVNDFASIIETEWRFYCKSEHFLAICAESIEFWLERYGETTVGEMFLTLGFDKVDLSKEFGRYSKLWLDVAEEGGHLDHFLRRHLSGFYSSEELCQAFLKE